MRRDEILDLTKRWYEYVNQDHHKDRDCHWHIVIDYAYGDELFFQAQHYGYLFLGDEKPQRATYEEAERDLLNLIREAIGEQREWVDEVLADKSKWDVFQISKAKKFKELFDE